MTFHKGSSESGELIFDAKAIEDIYNTGRGSVRVQRRRPRGYRADDYKLYCCTERRFVYNFRDRRRLPL